MAKILSKIYKRFFWNSYDNIGNLIALNVIWFLIFPLPTYLCFRLIPVTGAARIALLLSLGLLTHSFAASGVFAATASMASRKETSLKQFAGDGRKYFVRMLLLGLLFGAVFFLLFHSIRFYSGLPAGGRILGFFLAGIQMWILAFCLLMQVHLLPLLFMKDWKVKQAIKWSAMLVVLKPGFTVLMFVQAFALSVIISVTGVGAVLLVYSLMSLFLNTTLRETLRDMEVRWVPKKKPTSWKEIFADEDQEQEKRTLKDLLRPWE